jgi:hypothetical protein
MRHLCFIVLGLCAASSFAQNAKPASVVKPHPDFTGVWKYQPRPISPNRETDQIDHQEPVMEITPIVGRQDVVYSLFCRTDGKGPQGPNASRQTRCDAHWEGSTYMFETRSIRNGAAITTYTALSLSDDGKTMTKQIRTTGPDGATERTIVFDKFSSARGGVTIGDTMERVRFQLGEPDKIIEEGGQKILIYGDMDWVFIDGTMVDGVGGAHIGDRPPVYPGDVQFGWTKDQVVQVYKQPKKVIQLNGKEIDFYPFSALAYSDGKLVYMSEAGQTKAEVLAIFGQPSRTVEWTNKVYAFYPFMTATYAGDKLITIGPSAY